MQQHRVKSGRWQTRLTIAGMIAVINSLIAGVLGALIAGRFIHALWVPIAIGLVVFLVSGLTHQRHHMRV